MKYIYLTLGFIFFGLGALGAILPVLPTTPFLLVASFCFARGSDRFHAWFISTKLYQKHLNNFMKNRAMTLKAKCSILAFASTMLILSFVMMNNIYGRIAIICIILFKYYYFCFRITTIKPESPRSEVRPNIENCG